MASIPTGSTDQKKGRKKMSIKMDMTPMVDLAFLLLTFFILTTTLNKPFVMELKLPEKPDDAEPLPPLSAKRIINLVLDKDNAIFWYKGLDATDKQKTNYRDVRTLLLDKKKEIRNMVVIIKPTSKSRYKNLIDIMDEMSITKVKDYYIMKAANDDVDLSSALLQ